MIEQTNILAPMAVQMILMILIAFWLVWARVGSVIRGKVDIKDVARDGWQGWVKNAGDNYSNQYELPVVFFAACLTLFVTKNVTDLAIMLAWAFVVLRIIHAGIHLTFNNINIRFLVFLLGALCLTGLVILTAQAVL